MSPALIFDELEEEPFTENRRWRDSELKIHTHLQTATDFVGVSAIVTVVCRSGQHRSVSRHDNVLNRRAVFAAYRWSNILLLASMSRTWLCLLMRRS